MSYWGTGYWGTGYWADGYWAEGASSPSVNASTLYVERVVEVVKFTLKRKTSGSDTFYVSQEYWAADTLYTGNPEIYPVLAETIASARSIGTDRLGVRHELDIPIYGKSHFSSYGIGFGDLIDQYELRSSTAEIRRYFRTKDGVLSHDDDTNIRQTLEITGLEWSGDILKVRCKDTFFEDKEISKRFDPAGTDFDQLPDEWHYEYGSIVFGSGEGGNGVIIDAPLILETGTQSKFARFFSGWTFTGHPNNSLAKIYSRNKHKQQDESEWLDLALVANATSAWSGNASLTDAGDVYPRHLSEYSRGIVISPATSARRLTLIRADIGTTAGYWAANFSGSNNLFRVGDRAFSPGDQSFSISCWVRFDTIQEQAICGQGNLSDGTGEWGLFMISTGRIAIAISSNGTAYTADARWGSAAVTGTWYHVFAYHDAVNREIGISINNGTLVTTSTVTRSNTCAGSGTETDGRHYVTLDASASAVNNAYQGRQFFASGGTASGDIRYGISYTGSTKRLYIDPQTSPGADGTTTYAIHEVPNRRKPDGSDKNGPFQVGYIGGVANHLDGRVAQLGFWVGGVVSSTYRTSMYNSGNGKAYEHLDDNEKTNLAAWWDLNEFYGARRDAHGSKDLSDAGSVGSAPGKVASGPSNEKGELRFRIFHAKFLKDDGTWAPDGSALFDTAVDISESLTTAIALGYKVLVPLDPPLDLSPNASYFVQIDWTNHEQNQYSFWCNYQAVVGQEHYAKLNTQRDQGWVLQDDVQLAIALHVAGDGSGFEDGTATEPQHSYFEMEGYGGEYSTFLEFPSLAKDSDFKAGVLGLEDDSSGTYTGSASSVMQNLVHILRFILQHDELLGIDPAQIRSAALETLNDELGSTYRLGFAIDRETYAGDLIRKMCKQADFCFYKTRKGELTVARSAYHAGTFDHSLDEGRLRDQLQVLAVVDTPADQIFNDFSINFGADPLNTPKDAALLRRAGSDSWKSNVYLNASESSAADTTRQANMSTSQARYGKLQYREDFDLFPADSGAPAATLARLADRYYLKGKRLTFRVPLKDYYDSDLFDHYSIRHTELPRDGGTSKKVVWHNDGEPISWHYRGVPATWMRLGRIDGEVIAVAELDQWLEVTVETQNPFF